MKKLINAPADYVAEALAGMVAAHPDTFTLTGASRRVVVRATPKPSGRVGVITGGGFGHLALFAGYVGQGLLDACAVGDVFAGPSADSVGEAFAAADHGAGVLAVIGNYGGDRLSPNRDVRRRRRFGLRRSHSARCAGSATPLSVCAEPPNRYEVPRHPAVAIPGARDHGGARCRRKHWPDGR